MNMQSIPTVFFILDKDKLSPFFSILQQGFMVQAYVGCSIKQFLCDQWGVTPEYLSGRISTIFLNGKPVDNVETAMIFDNDVLALSAAMPGLAGATFRTGGLLSAFRSSITHRDEINKSALPTKGMITLKLFNLLVSELGLVFLKKGVFVKTKIMNEFFKGQTNWENIFESVIIDGQETKVAALNNLNWNDNIERIHVKILTKIK